MVGVLVSDLSSENVAGDGLSWQHNGCHDNERPRSANVVRMGGAARSILGGCRSQNRFYRSGSVFTTERRPGLILCDIRESQS
jgi:hypothetical protein